MGRKKKKVIASGARTSRERRDHSLSNYQQIISLVTKSAETSLITPVPLLLYAGSNLDSGAPT